jgi:hypothetical protein
MVGILKSLQAGANLGRKLNVDVDDAVDALGQPIGSLSDLAAMGDNNPPLNMRIDPLESVDYPAGFFPEYRGAAPNRTEPYPRYRPAKTTDRMQRLELSIADEANPINNIFDSYIEKGKALAGPDWYNTEELRDWMVGVLGKTEGDKQWREYLELVGTTSTGSKVPQNIRFASLYRAIAPEDRIRVAQMVKDEGVTPLAAAKELGVEPANIPDDFNFAADMHFMRMLAMSDGGGDFLSAQAKLSGENARIASEVIGPRRIKNYTSTRMVNGKEMSEINLFKAWKDGHIKDTSPFQEIPTAWSDTPKANEYAAYEDMANRVSAKYGMTPAQFQASLWMGAGDITGLADESQGTFMELFRRSLDKRAGERGLTRKEMLNDFIKNKAVLSVPVGGVGFGALSGMDEDEEGPI